MKKVGNLLLAIFFMGMEFFIIFKAIMAINVSESLVIDTIGVVSIFIAVFLLYVIWKMYPWVR